MRLVLLACSLLVSSGLEAGCTSIRLIDSSETSQRYFIEVDRPGAVYSVLQNVRSSSAQVRLLEIGTSGNPLGDTLDVWVQHFNGQGSFPRAAAQADLIIACYRERQPAFARERHVLPDSRGPIYVYMMRGGVLIVSDALISFYDVLLAAEKSRR